MWLPQWTLLGAESELPPIGLKWSRFYSAISISHWMRTAQQGVLKPTLKQFSDGGCVLTVFPATGGGSGQLISAATADLFSTHMQSLFISCILMASFQKYIKYFICMANLKMIQHLKQNISRTKLLIHPPQYVPLTVFPMSVNSNCIIPVA